MFAGTCIASPGKLWEYEENDGNWKSYDLASCELLRIAQNSGRITTVVHSTDDKETHSFEIDFELNQHVNRSTNKWHNIRLNAENHLIQKYPGKKIIFLHIDRKLDSSLFWSKAHACI